MKNIGVAIFAGLALIAASIAFSQKTGTPVISENNGALVTNRWSGEVFICRLAPSPGDQCTRIYPDTPRSPSQ